MTSQNTQSWLSAQLLGSQNGAKADKPTIEPALIQLLDDYFNARTPAATAAARFRSIIIGREENPAQPGKDEWSTFYDPWTLFFTAAEKCPEAQEQLVDLLAAIASLEDDKTSTTSDHVLVWKTLPVFRALYREKWNPSLFGLTPPHHANRLQSRQNWLDFNAFGARLTARDVQDLRIFALWALREVLETKIGKKQADDTDNASSSAAPTPNASLHHQTFQHIDDLLPAAVQWLLISGRQIFTSTAVYESGSGRGDPARGGELWDGVHGFCRDRWDFWRSRLEALLQPEIAAELARETVEWARRAVDVMVRISK